MGRLKQKESWVDRKCFEIVFRDVEGAFQVSQPKRHWLGLCTTVPYGGLFTAIISSSHMRCFT
jgi:hypothetical protein